MENSAGFWEGDPISGSSVGGGREHPPLLTPGLQHCLFLCLKQCRQQERKRVSSPSVRVSTRRLSQMTSSQSPGTSMRSAQCGHFTEKSTGLREVKGLSASECVCSVTQLCPHLCSPIDCSQPGSSVHGILQAIILEVCCHFLLQGISPTSGIKSTSLASTALAGGSFTSPLRLLVAQRVKNIPKMQETRVQSLRISSIPGCSPLMRSSM